MSSDTNITARGDGQPAQITEYGGYEGKNLTDIRTVGSGLMDGFQPHTVYGQGGGEFPTRLIRRFI